MDYRDFGTAIPGDGVDPNQGQGHKGGELQEIGIRQEGYKHVFHLRLMVWRETGKLAQISLRFLRGVELGP